MPTIRKRDSLNLPRRDFLKISAIAGAVLAAGGVWGRRVLDGPSVVVRETRLLMGIILDLEVVAPSQASGRRAIRATLDEMSRLVGIFDHRKPTATLAKLNGEGGLSLAPLELVQVLRRSVQYGDLTSGAFDVTVKPVLDAIRSGWVAAGAQDLVDFRKIRIDGSRLELVKSGMAVTLDGIAKGYIVDRAVDVLKSRGFVDVLIEAGGDLRGVGSAPTRPWRIGVQDPRAEQDPSLLTSFDLPPGAAATSGDYQNAFTADRSIYHIIDPRRGTSPAELASATVLAPRAVDADALSTSLMVLGETRGLALIEQLPGIEALVVTKDKRIQWTSGFPANKQLRVNERAKDGEL